ncbi:hypothetical protein [Streptomyces pseudovenezuelae]|uniref:Uncharacterized protein n=1 Tax=Streptomyces pseudovenezuelae TaxID=67350 RepID=A0ABZ1WMT8_9ACTN|nr:hypothetical protein [Streptomyces pseudovenezuelae]
MKIDIPEVLIHLRAEAPEALAKKAAGAVLSSPRRLAAFGGRLIARDGRIGALPGPFARWSGTRDTPAPAREWLRTWWRRTRTPTGEDRPKTTEEGKVRR